MRARSGTHVLDDAIIGGKQGKQLHRQQRRRRQERFDDALVHDRAGTDPIEILETARQRGLAVLILGHAFDDRPEVGANLDRAKVTSSGHSLAEAARGRPPGTPHQAEDITERRAHNQRILVRRDVVRTVRDVRSFGPFESFSFFSFSAREEAARPILRASRHGRARRRARARSGRSRCR